MLVEIIQPSIVLNIFTRNRWTKNGVCCTDTCLCVQRSSILIDVAGVRSRRRSCGERTSVLDHSNIVSVKHQLLFTLYTTQKLLLSQQCGLAVVLGMRSSGGQMIKVKQLTPQS
jgi:hypothetical protein